jgi:hypothetical protein
MLVGLVVYKQELGAFGLRLVSSNKCPRIFHGNEGAHAELP